MTDFVLRYSKALPKPPRQVAPSPPRYACHLSRFNGRAYSRKGGLPLSKYHTIYCIISQNFLFFNF